MNKVLEKILRTKQPIAIIGLGISGLAAARFCHREAIPFLGFDELPEERFFENLKNSSDRDFFTSLHERFFWGVKEIPPVLPLSIKGGIVSPGFSPESRMVKSLGNLPWCTELELGLNLFSGKRILVTGTNGKSTVTALTHHLLTVGGLHSFGAGNLGTPVLDFAPSDTLGGGDFSGDVMVAETSSYQLECFQSEIIDIGIFLNLFENHLERHGTMEEYFSAKMKIFENLSPHGIGIVDIDSPWGRRAKDAFPTKKIATISSVDTTATVLREYDRVIIQGKTSIPWTASSLIGDHNHTNISFASYAALLCGVSEDQIVAGLKSFKGLPHRLEFVQLNPVIINDSKSTTPDATITALKACVGRFPKNTIHLLLGGRAKRASWEGVASQLSLMKGMVEVRFFGESRAEIQSALGITGEMFSTMKDAFFAAREVVTTDDIILLSPGCASFDEFRGFEHRGDVFRGLAVS